MANEFFLNGLSCIGRATGGIVQQIVPNREALSFTRAVSSKSDRWHLQGAPPTGFLFREDNRIKSALDDWQAINAADYAIDEPGKNRLEKRQELNLVRSMVSEMKDCLEDAAGLYISDHEKYLKFIIDGISFIKENFSWEYSAKKYLEKLPE
jgi:hypothetical protein